MITLDEMFTDWEGRVIWKITHSNLSYRQVIHIFANEDGYARAKRAAWIGTEYNDAYCEFSNGVLPIMFVNGQLRQVFPSMRPDYNDGVHNDDWIVYQLLK